MLLKRPISKNYPRLSPIIRNIKILIKNIQYLYPNYSKKYSSDYKIYRVYKSSSLLRRKLGNTDPKLAEAKIHNLKKALPSINNINIPPGNYFSFWNYIGNPSYKNGFVDGMLLEDGKVTVGVGGGLCQLANMVHWLLLHTDLVIYEHWHHDYDIFPDNGRTIPFGSGAGVLFNYFDLQYFNNTNQTFTLSFQLTDKLLKGEVWSNKKQEYKYSIQENNHRFYRSNNEIFRENELYRIKIDKKSGNIIDSKLVKYNNSKVMYPVDTTTIDIVQNNNN